MATELTLRIILESPTRGVVFGLQEGKGSDYNTIQKATGDGQPIVFEFSARYKIEDKCAVLLGPLAQGPPDGRYVYIDIGSLAGQAGSFWSRRLKIPLTGIGEDMVQQCLADPGLVLVARVPGIGKDGSPNCGTVKPFGGWMPERL